MSRAFFSRRSAHRLPLIGGLITILLIVTGCTTSVPAPPPVEPPAAINEEYIPVTRYGRYTLVELSPTAGQRDLLSQIVDVSIPDTLEATVNDGLRHVLQRSGYRLCETIEATIFNSLPLPAAHYQLGPLMLRDALQTLAGLG